LQKEWRKKRVRRGRVENREKKDGEIGWKEE
jgi:hypothetical protein